MSNLKYGNPDIQEISERINSVYWARMNELRAEAIRIAESLNPAVVASRTRDLKNIETRFAAGYYKQSDVDQSRDYPLSLLEARMFTGLGEVATTSLLAMAKDSKREFEHAMERQELWNFHCFMVEELLSHPVEVSIHMRLPDGSNAIDVLASISY